jgi:hypothetical protein
MTPAVIQTLPGGTQQDSCWLCQQHISEDLHLPLDDPNYARAHEVKA